MFYDWHQKAYVHIAILMVKSRPTDSYQKSIALTIYTCAAHMVYKTEQQKCVASDENEIKEETSQRNIKMTNKLCINQMK